MQTLNLNMLFIDMFPSYGFVMNAWNEGQKVSKQEFTEKCKQLFDTRENARNLLFLQSIELSRFETVKRWQGQAVFNE